VPGGSVAFVPGAVSGIESEAVIDGTSLSGAMSQDRLPSAPRIQARAAARGQKSRVGRPCRPKGRSTGPRLFFASVWDDRRGPAPHVSEPELKGDGGLAYG